MKKFHNDAVREAVVAAVDTAGFWRTLDNVPGVRFAPVSLEQFQNPVIAENLLKETDGREYLGVVISEDTVEFYPEFSAEETIGTLIRVMSEKKNALN